MGHVGKPGDMPIEAETTETVVGGFDDNRLKR